METNKLIVTNEEGKEVEMEIMFTFNYNKKDFVVYFDPNDPDEDTDVFASIYDENGNLYPIESDEEWDVVDQMVASFIDDNEENAN